MLSTLGWKMRALTPCSFIDYFLSKLTNGEHPTNSSISRSIQLIVGTTRGTPQILFQCLVFCRFLLLRSNDFKQCLLGNQCRY